MASQPFILPPSEETLMCASSSFWREQISMRKTILVSICFTLLPKETSPLQCTSLSLEDLICTVETTEGAQHYTGQPIHKLKSLLFICLAGSMVWMIEIVTAIQHCIWLSKVSSNYKAPDQSGHCL